MSEQHHSGPHQPNHHHADAERVRCFVLTVSDSRSLENDEGGKVVAEGLRALGHNVVRRELVRDEVEAIRRVVMDVVDGGEVDFVVTTGGTGIAHRDVTPEALEPLFRCRLEGFGETFRRISYETIGPAAILTRASAGIIHHTLVVALPGAPAACRLAVETLLGPILSHAVGLLRASSPRPRGSSS
jgi:molybdenum cofactor biosynthesis protein B